MDNPQRSDPADGHVPITAGRPRSRRAFGARRSRRLPLSLARASPSADTARAMSQENVEIVRRTYPAFNRGDIPEFLESVDLDVEWIPIMAALEGRVYRGHDGVRQWIEDLMTDWGSFEVHAE